MCGGRNHVLAGDVVTSFIAPQDDHGITGIQDLVYSIAESVPDTPVRIKHLFDNGGSPNIRCAVWETGVLYPFDIVRTDPLESRVVFLAETAVEFLNELDIVLAAQKRALQLIVVLSPAVNAIVATFPFIVTSAGPEETSTFGFAKGSGIRMRSL